MRTTRPERRTPPWRAAMGTVAALMAAAMMAAGAESAFAQAGPSLASTISGDASIQWDAPAAAAPMTSAHYLEPVSAEAGLVEPPCASCQNGGDGDGGGVYGAYPYNRCGCSAQLFPWFTGPGNCDNWCVGPHWNVEVDGLFIRRESAPWADVPGVVFADQFDYGPGVRVFATGYNDSNFGLQIGYEGVNDYHALADTATDEITYESTLNSVEINGMRRTDIPLKLFAGFRYLQIDEDFVAVTTATGDGQSSFVQNRFMGPQVGIQRDAWQLNRWLTIEPYGNVGAYLNDFKRENVTIVGGAYTFDVNEFTEMAFIGEAGVTGVLRINRCVALRAGYQVIAIDGVGTALDAALGAPGLEPDTLVYHGARFGVEYQR